MRKFKSNLVHLYMHMNKVNFGTDWKKMTDIGNLKKILKEAELS